MLYDPKWQMSPVSKALLAAAEYIEQHGWGQGAIQDGAGRVCIVGALYLASPDSEAQSAAHAVLENEVGPHIALWNDEPGRTQAEVVAKLRHAAAAAPQYEAQWDR